MIENARARRGAFEIEEAVVGQVDDRGAVGAGCEADRQSPKAPSGDTDANVQSAGIPLLAVGADIGKRHARLSAVLDLGDLPELPVKAVRPAMKRMLAVVGRQSHHIAVENEARVRDTVGIAADGRAEEPPVAEVASNSSCPSTTSSQRPSLSGTINAWSAAPYVMMRASKPFAARRDTRSTGRPSGNAPNISLEHLALYQPWSIFEAFDDRRRPSRKASATRRSGVRSTSLLPVAANSIKRR